MPRLVWLWMGHFFLALGTVGIFLPLLPTAPFILLASACYSRGSTRLEAWLLNHKVFGATLRNWRQYHVINRRAKALASLSIGAGIAWVWLSDKIPVYGKWAMVTVVTPVWIFLITRPSQPPLSVSHGAGGEKPEA